MYGCHNAIKALGFSFSDTLDGFIFNVNLTVRNTNGPELFGVRVSADPLAKNRISETNCVQLCLTKSAFFAG